MNSHLINHTLSLAEEIKEELVKHRRHLHHLPFKSSNNYMHACGHDIHATIMLGAAKLLKEKENKINGTVKNMSQPAEEIGVGAKDMVANGVLENPKVDAALALHVAPDLGSLVTNL